MSFGFAVGDFIAVGNLAWSLYRDCYKVARDAPQDFQLLVNELSVMSSSLNMLQEEVNDPESTVFQSGEQRVKLVKEILGNVHDTLIALQKYTARYDISGSKPGSTIQLRQKIRNFKWSIHQKSIDELRGRVHQHNGILTLLLSSAGNSSLQRIQNTTNVLDENVRVIRDFITKQQDGKDLLAPSLSIVDDDDELRSSISAILLKNAEVVQPWTTIGVTQWIDTGRWWLQGFELGIDELTLEDSEVPIPTYTSLIKASWILIDIITCHPQVTFVSNTTRAQITALCSSIRGNFERIRDSQYSTPNLDLLRESDLQIWESQTTAPVLRKNHRSILGQRVPKDHWTLDDVNATKPRLLCNDQTQQAVVDIDCTNELRMETTSDSVIVNDCEIFLKKTRDLALLSTIVETMQTYYHDRKCERHYFEGFIIYFCLITLKNQNHYLDFPFFNLEQLPVNMISSEPIVHSLKSAALRLWADPETVGMKLIDDLDYERTKMKLLAWIMQINQTRIVELLLADDLIFVVHPSNQLTRFQLAARCSLPDVARILVDDASKKGSLVQEISEKNQFSWSALHYACSHGDEQIARLFLRHGAKINDAAYADYTPLHCAAFHGLASTAQLLIDKGADVEVKDDEGRTPLLLSLMRKCGNVVGLLLDEGADTLVTDDYGTGTIHYALAGDDSNFFAADPISRESYNALYAKWATQYARSPYFPPSPSRASERLAEVAFELNSDWGILFLDLPDASIKIAGEALPESVKNRHNRALWIDRPAHVKEQFFSITLEFDVEHHDDYIDFSVAHGYLGPNGQPGSARLRVRDKNDPDSFWREHVTHQTEEHNRNFQTFRIKGSV